MIPEALPMPNDLMSIPAAAREAGEPERSLYRAVDNGDVPCTEEDGVRLVRLADVQAWAAGRARPTALPAPISGPAATILPASLPLAAGGGGKMADRLAGPILTPEVYQAIFGLFAQGVSLEDIVRLHGHDPDVVETARARWDRLRKISGPRPELLDELRSELLSIGAVVAGVRDLAQDTDASLTSLRNNLSPFIQETRTAVADLSTRIAALEQRASSLEQMLTFISSLR